MDTSRSEILEKIKQRLTRSGISITKVIPTVRSFDDSKTDASVPESSNLKELFNRDPFDNPPFFTDVDKIKKMLSLDYRTEVELSVGSYHENGSFDPNVFSKISFDNVRKGLSAIKSMSVIVNDDIVEIASSDEGTIRRLTDQEGSTFQRKKRSKDTVDNDIWGYRISSSTETFIEEPKNFKPTLTRKRHRYTFIETSSSGDFYGVRFDLSVIEEIGKTFTNYKHEIEIERESTIAKDKKLSIRTFENAYKFVLMALQNVKEENLLMTLQERKYAVLAHNSLINPPVKEAYNKMSLKDLRRAAKEAGCKRFLGSCFSREQVGEGRGLGRTGSMRMKRFGSVAAAGVGLSLFLTGCGGGISTTTPPPPTTHVLTVNSTNPASGVAITVSPADTNGATNGTTSFTRTYDAGASVTLTAPATAGGNTFSA